MKKEKLTDVERCLIQGGTSIEDIGVNPKSFKLTFSEKYYKGYDDYCNANSGLKDKLKTTPDSHIRRLKLNLTIDWSKVFKRGWLLWK
jgi:hypothetical protein